MSSNLFAGSFNSADCFSESAGNPSGGLNQLNSPTVLGLGFGNGFRPKQTGAVLYLFRIPNAVTLATGLTVSLVIADDVLNPGAGLNVVLGVTVGPVASGTSTLDENSTTGPLHGSTEVTATVTMPSTSGVLKIPTDIAVPVADMNSIAAGGWAVVRVRRLGTNSSDTHPGVVVIPAIDVRDT